MAEKKYKVILADPPWSYQVFSQVPAGRPSARPYKAMRMVDIFSLPVDSIAEDDALLFMWATSPLLPEALHCMKAWGFNFKCVAFTWVKRNKKSDGWFWGMGWWTRSNPEYLLLGIKGDPKRENADVHSVLDYPVGDHSKKPAEVRQRIERLCGEAKRVELFARERAEGWDAWGNEVESDIDLLKVGDGGTAVQCELLPANASFSREPERSGGESAGSDSYGGTDD